MLVLATSVNGHWVDDLSPFIVRFSGNFGIRYYGLSYVLGFLTGTWLLFLYAKKGRSRIPAGKIGDLMTAIVAGVLVGGRLGSYLLYDGWRNFSSDPLEIFRVWDGGMASHGGMIGVAIAVFWFARSQKVSFLHVSDLITSTASAGFFFGRLANFVNGELWGKITSVSWGVIFPRSMPDQPIELIPPRHPSQLYQAGLEGLLLLAYMQWRFWKSDAVRTQPGRISGEYLIGYAICRAIGEVYREPDVGVSLILGLSRGTFYSLFLIAGGAALILSSRPRRPAG